MPEHHTDETSTKQKRKFVQADDLDVSDIKKRCTSGQIESKEDGISSDDKRMSLPNVAADSVVSGVRTTFGAGGCSWCRVSAG